MKEKNYQSIENCKKTKENQSRRLNQQHVLNMARHC